MSDFKIRANVIFVMGDVNTCNRYRREINDIDPSAVVRLREIIKESQG